MSKATGRESKYGDESKSGLLLAFVRWEGGSKSHDHCESILAATGGRLQLTGASLPGPNVVLLRVGG